MRAIKLRKETTMAEEIREIIRRELPRLITEDPELHNWVWNIVHEHSLSRAETESRFEKVLAEIRRVQERFRTPLGSQ
jgi:hypothetical protein